MTINGASRQSSSMSFTPDWEKRDACRASVLRSSSRTSTASSTLDRPWVSANESSCSSCASFSRIRTSACRDCIFLSSRSISHDRAHQGDAEQAGGQYGEKQFISEPQPHTFFSVSLPLRGEQNFFNPSPYASYSSGDDTLSSLSRRLKIFMAFSTPSTRQVRTAAAARAISSERISIWDGAKASRT